MVIAALLLGGALIAPTADAATLTVDSATGAGQGTLAEAIATANRTPQSDRVVFAPDVGGTIALSSKLPDVTAPLDIQGPGPRKLTLSGDGADSLFYLQAGGAGEVRIAGLTLSGGIAADGGAIASFGTDVVLDHTVLKANRATNAGGALNVTEGSLTVLDSSLLGNSATYPGGAIELYNARMRVSGSTVRDNSAGSNGGGIDVGSASGPLVIERSTIAGNRSGGDGGGVSVSGSPPQPLDLTGSKISGNAAAGNGDDVSPPQRAPEAEPAPAGAKAKAVDASAPIPAASAGSNGTKASLPQASAASNSIISTPLTIFGPQSTTGPSSTLLNGIALAPPSAPEQVQAVISAANMISSTPYIWGGGHGSWYSTGYDCSGAVSFALHGGGFLSTPLASGSLESWGAPGPGKWITVYANPGHAYAVIAGLRWDTVGDARGSGPRWHLAGAYPQGFVARHPPGF